MPVTTRQSKFTAAEKVAIKALVEMKGFEPLPLAQQRPRRACTIKQEPVPAPKSAMDRPRRSGVRY
jgi:hypothetical protein